MKQEQKQKEVKNNKNIYKMKLNEEISLTKNDSIVVIRVAGGWLYRFVRLDCNQMNVVFVPFNNEFQENK